jgi:hypothetical protein
MGEIGSPAGIGEVGFLPGFGDDGAFMNGQKAAGHLASRSSGLGALRIAI